MSVSPKPIITYEANAEFVLEFMSCCLCSHLNNFLILAYRIADGWELSLPIYGSQFHETRREFS
jgi:hypothetical protein